VRGVDVWFVLAERIRSSGIPEGFWEGAPDLAVEVVDFQDMEWEVLERVNDLLEGGTPLVWVVYPKLEQVRVCGADGSVRTLEKCDTLEDERVLPGFRCVVSEIFMKV
jgi:Uma2 family endonuclease